MANQQQNPWVIAGLIVVIIVALTFMVKSTMPKRYRPPDVNWICEDCGNQFIEAAASFPSECPQCGSTEVVRSIKYKCEKCSSVFEAYRTKMPRLDTSKEDPEGMPPEMIEGLIKKPDGKWVNQMSKEGMKIMEELSCPNCGNKDRALLKYSPLASK